MTVLHPDLLAAIERDQPIDVKVWRPGLISFPLFSQGYCAHLITRAEQLGVWDAVKDDWERKTAGYAGKEVGIGRLGEAETMLVPFERYLLPAVRAYYKVEVTQILEPFIIRYTTDGITKMDKHRDRRGLVSGVIRLNDDFRGCRLRFPELNFDGGAITVGHVLLFPKHFLHEVTELESGRRYSLALWASGEPLHAGTGSSDDRSSTRTDLSS
ncbi:MAG: hypothetical protein ACE5K1_11770 [Acidiferrobacterales bacterium]